MSKMPEVKIKDWLNKASNSLKTVGIDSHKLDSELILSRAFDKDRSYIHANSEQYISSDICQTANKWLNDRKKRIPLAYIFGYREFYGRNFKVTKNTLIPRPESENIINLLLELIKPSHKTLIDIGTGSGCLGITAKLEIPRLKIKLTDVSSKAIKVAKINAKNLMAKVSFQQVSLLNRQNQPVDIILANLPYVDKSWQCSPETAFEPSIALFSNDSGLELIKSMIKQASNIISTDGLIIIEAEPIQHKNIILYAKKYNLLQVKTSDFIVVLTKPKSLR